MENNNNNAPKKLSQSTNGLNGAKVQPGSPSASPKTPVGVQKKPFESQKGVDKRMNKMFEETKQPTLGQWDGKGSDPVKVEFNPNLNKTKEINSKITKQMGLSENDLEPIDQSPLYKAKMAAIEAGKKGGYRDYSDFNEKGELVARPARTVSLLGDSNKFHPDAQIRGIKDFGDHFEYQLKNPGDADFRDFRYDDKNGDWSKDLWDFKQKDEARIKANGSASWSNPTNTLKEMGFEVDEPDSTGATYFRNGNGGEYFFSQNKENGLVDIHDRNGNVLKSGLNFNDKKSIDDAMADIAFNNDDEEKEYEGVDGDYERSYGPVTNDKEYQAYLKWKENGDSFDNVGDKIRNQMGISEEEWNEPYNDGMVNIDKGKPRISNANLTTAFVDGKISGKEYYKEVNDRIKENNRKMQLMTSQVPYNGLDAKSKEEYDRIKEQNDEWNFIIDEYDLDNKYADSKVLNQMGLGNEDDIEDKAMEIVSNEGRNAFKSFLNGQLTDEQYEKNVKDKLMSELGVDEQQAQDLWNKYGGYLGGGLNPMNEEQKAAALNQMGLDEEEEINDKIGGRGFEMDDGRYLNVELKNGKLYAGSATNSGIMQEYSIDYDSDVSLDQNLQNLYDKITEEDLNNN